jgi:peptidoglycan/LPS O-acetylase OafA/YrhL
LALAFANLYLVNRAEQWWAILPSGFMAVLAGVIALTATVTRLETLGAILFAGMGVVFALLYLLAGKRRHWWALIPAGVLLLFGLLTYAVDSGVQTALWQWWPSALIVVGAVLAFLSTVRRAPPERLSVNVAPAPRTGTPTKSPPSAPPGQLGEYTQPAPGASVEILPDPDRR